MQAKSTEPAPSEVQSLRPDPTAWKAALRLADGDATRLKVVSETVVIVQNRGRTRKS